jgi:hypothetical protein
MNQKSLHREKSLGTISPKDVPLKAIPTVDLTSQEVQRVTHLAERRNASYEEIDGGDVFGQLDSLTSHQIGILGELAVAKFYGLSIDSSTYKYGDGGRDFRLFDDGYDVDVKTTATDQMRIPELLVQADKDLVADLFVLAHIIGQNESAVRVRLLGCAKKATVKDRRPRKHPGRMRNYVVGPEELTLLPHLPC